MDLKYCFRFNYCFMIGFCVACGRHSYLSTRAYQAYPDPYVGTEPRHMLPSPTLYDELFQHRSVLSVRMRALGGISYLRMLRSAQPCPVSKQSKF